MYTTVKDGLVNLLKTLELTESAETDTFKEASDSEYENTFILNCESGESDDANEQQSAFLYDNQKWTVQVAFGTSNQSNQSQIDAIQIKKDEILATLDDPTNWRSFCTLLRYRSWSIKQESSYLILTVELKVKDLLTY